MEPNMSALGIPASSDARGNPTRFGGTEHDLLAVDLFGDEADVIFGQVKAMQGTANALEVITKAFHQLIRDVESFLQLYPDVDHTMAMKIQFKPLVILVSTTCLPSVCSNCEPYLVFRGDLTPGALDHGSWAENLAQDLSSQASITSRPGLVSKVRLGVYMPPTLGVQGIGLTVSARYGSFSSLYPLKDYGTFLTKTIKMLGRMDTQVVPRGLKRALETGSECDALLLNTQQVQRLGSGSVMLTGMYGAGKTTVGLAVRCGTCTDVFLPRASSAPSGWPWGRILPVWSTSSPGTRLRSWWTGSRPPSPPCLG